MATNNVFKNILRPQAQSPNPTPVDPNNAPGKRPTKILSHAPRKGGIDFGMLFRTIGGKK